MSCATRFAEHGREQNLISINFPGLHEEMLLEKKAPWPKEFWNRLHAYVGECEARCDSCLVRVRFAFVSSDGARLTEMFAVFQPPKPSSDQMYPTRMIFFEICSLP
jgi:hypothetical protein